MRLVKSGHVVDDTYVRVPDDAPIPDGVPAIVSAARFLADAQGIAGRAAPTGVQWPNSRKVAAEQFHDVPDEDVRRIVELNARELFRFPR